LPTGAIFTFATPCKETASFAELLDDMEETLRRDGLYPQLQLELRRFRNANMSLELFRTRYSSVELCAWLTEAGFTLAAPPYTTYRGASMLFITTKNHDA
jgi:hypothetical protein